MRRHVFIAFLFSLLALLFFSCEAVPGNQLIFQDYFSGGSLDLSRWQTTSDGDFKTMTVDTVDVAPGGDTDYRLRLQADTIGTSTPVKYLGVRSRAEVSFEYGVNIAFDIDWNNQSNGSYMTGAFYLCPTASDNPEPEGAWLKFEYIGVPPGHNVRINIWQKVDRAVMPLFTDWGPRDENGKPLGLPLGSASHRIGMELDRDALQVSQDGKQIYPLSAHELNFTEAYIYLQMSSGTNYPSREIYFDNIEVRGRD